MTSDEREDTQPHTPFRTRWRLVHRTQVALVKVGDLVVMPNETLAEGESQSVGLVVDDVVRYRTPHSTRGRIGILWHDSDDGVDYEPADWLEVVANCQDYAAQFRAALNP